MIADHQLLDPRCPRCRELLAASATATVGLNMGKFIDHVNAIAAATGTAET